MTEAVCDSIQSLPNYDISRLYCEQNEETRGHWYKFTKTRIYTLLNIRVPLTFQVTSYFFIVYIIFNDFEDSAPPTTTSLTHLLPMYDVASPVSHPACIRHGTHPYPNTTSCRYIAKVFSAI